MIVNKRHPDPLLAVLGVSTDSEVMAHGRDTDRLDVAFVDPTVTVVELVAESITALQDRAGSHLGVVVLAIVLAVVGLERKAQSPFPPRQAEGVQMRQVPAAESKVDGQRQLPKAVASPDEEIPGLPR